MLRAGVAEDFKAYLIWRGWEGDGRNTVASIVLHGWGGRCEQLQPVANELFPGGQVFAAEAPREVHPYTSSPSTEDKGCYWFNMHAGRRADALRFTDSLWRLEDFLIDVVRHRGEAAGPLYLLGEDQGADMALALAATAPEFLSGVIAIAPQVEAVPRWSPPETAPSGLPILVWRADGRSSPLAGVLARRGADLTELGGGLPATWAGRLPAIRDWLANLDQSAPSLTTRL